VVHKHRGAIFIFSIFLIIGSFVCCARQSKAPEIVISKKATFLESTSARELRRYVYLLTGELAPIRKLDYLDNLKNSAIIISQEGRLLFKEGEGESLIGKISRDKFPKLNSEDYWLKTIKQSGKTHLLIAGGDGAGILYGTYYFLEKLGVRYYLDGDVVPENKIVFQMPELDEIGKPLFRLRGIQPFHDFPEGPDWWNLDNYKAILGQLPKLRMNFFGLHTYPEKGPNAEPTVWIGLPTDFSNDGKVRFSYPSSYQNTLRGNWGYEAKETGDFQFGASQLFERDDYGNDVMEGMCPEPKTPEDFNKVFDRAASVFNDAFGFARSLRIKTCVGTETSLTIPELVQKRLKDMGKNPKDPALVKELYKGMFSRIAAAYPIDYYWLWTWEGWTWDDASPEQIKAVTSDLEQAVIAAKEAQAPFNLATCGWVLGPPSSRTLFDQVLPKNIAVSTINREVGKAPIDPSFLRIEGRSKWAIPWMEDDPSLTSPQLWVGRMRRDAADALRYGCDGLFGIHWRTRMLSANVLALARAAWDQSWNTLPKNLSDEVGPITGQYVAFKDKPISSTKEQAIYQDVRDRVFAYYIPVPNGTYSVTLKFCEGQIDRKRGRTFDVLLQGIKVLEKLDIFERVGMFKALDFTFKNVLVTEGRLAIDFADRIHYPSLAGIVIQGKNFTKKINCGGPAVLDYEADWPETRRYLASLDFYRDWSENQFGKNASNDIAEIFVKIDGKLPIPVNWVGGPGGLAPDKRPWEEVRNNYQFVDELAALQPKIVGKGHKERFDYWLKNFEYMREIAHFNCLWAKYNQAIDKAGAEKDDRTKATLARERALPIRIEMAGSLREIFGYLLETVSNTGELGTIANWEQHLLPAAWEKPGEELKKILGTGLPTEAELSKAYDGPPRAFVTAQRTSLEPGEELKLKIIVLAKDKPQEAYFYWREMGKGQFQSVPLMQIARGVYTVTCPGKDVDIEYYIKVRADNREICYPSTAPELNQTVVIFRK
jgi:hypothetical protein